MCFGGGAPSAPKTAAITPVVQPSEAISDQSLADAQREKRRQQAQAGAASTILTGGSGAGTPNTQQKTLIGS